MKLKKEMEKKGGGKDRANKIKVWQKEEMILDNQVNTLVIMMHLILSRNWQNFAKNLWNKTRKFALSQVLETVRNEMEHVHRVDQEQTTMKPMVLTSKESQNERAVTVISGSGAIQPNSETKKQPINEAAEKEIQELEDLLRCKVCLDCDACIVFFPCRHMVTCEYCEGLLQSCPLCRSVIEEAVKINEE